MYRIAGNFWGIQFSWMGDLQRFRDLIFADGRFKLLRPQYPFGYASYRTHARAVDRTRRKHATSDCTQSRTSRRSSARVAWLWSIMYDQLTSSKLIEFGKLSAWSMPCANHDGHTPCHCACAVNELVHKEFYFADLIFVVFESTAKTAKIGSLENFRL